MSLSRRSTPLPPGWDATRRRILERDQHRCYHCGAHATHVDHIIGAASGGTDEDTNLGAMCQPCHDTKTAREALTVRWATRERRPAEPHPGLA